MIFEREVYEVLTYRWQTGNEIREKIAKNRRKRRYQIAIGSVYACLSKLERYKFVEMNEREPTKEELKIRGNNKVSEYKKISRKEPTYDKFGGLEGLTDLGLTPA